MSRPEKLGDIVVDHFPVFDTDGYTKKSGETVFTTTLWKDAVEQVLSVVIAEIGSSGEYKVSFTPDAIGVWSVDVLADYNKDVWGAEYSVTLGSVDEIMDRLARILGLVHENIFIDNTGYDAGGQLIAARARIFDSKTNCDAATDGGSETTGLTAEYQLSTAWELLNQFSTFKQTKE